MYRLNNKKLICGVDEAGRGSLAGDVYAAAVILPDSYALPGLDDSKKINAHSRETLYDMIINEAVAYAVASASVAEINALNILNATILAMNRALKSLNPQADFALIDGNINAGITIPSRSIVRGDTVSPMISAASILAKVERDRYMQRLSEQYPLYAFDKHKGYGVKLHYERIAIHGVSPEHRSAFLRKPGGKNAYVRNGG